MAKVPSAESLQYTSPSLGAISTMQPTKGNSLNTINGTISRNNRFTYEDARCIRRDPTVRLARLLSVAPILAAAWSVENDIDADPRAIDFVDKIRKFRSHIIKEAAFGMIDYGWRGIEICWKLGDDQYLEVDTFNSLLPDITYVEPDEEGNFVGFRQCYTSYSGEIKEVEILGAAKAMLFNQRQEGVNFYGESDLETIQETKRRYDFANDIAEEYDRKSAGSALIIEYPAGRTLLNGVMTDNAEIARTLQATIRSNGGISIPRSVTGAIGNLSMGATANSLTNPEGWHIRLLESTGSSSAHLLSRAQHLETLMVRGIGLPERSLLEGKHGTKADAKVHADVALTSAIDRSDYILSVLNEGPIAAGLAFNFGNSQKGKVRLIAEPIGEDEKAFLRDVYMKILGGADSALLDLSNVDMAALREIAGIPSKHQDAADGKDTEEDPLNDYRDQQDDLDGE